MLSFASMRVQSKGKKSGPTSGLLMMWKMISLDLDETLIALCISALSNPAAQMALEHLKDLRG